MTQKHPDNDRKVVRVSLFLALNWRLWNLIVSVGRIAYDFLMAAADDARPSCEGASW
jgi:hypothetical protein